MSEVHEVHQEDGTSNDDFNGAKPQYQDCMAQIRRSMMRSRRQGKLAALDAPEIVIHIASALRKLKMISDDDVDFVKSVLPNQADLVERVDRIRKHSAEMVLSTTSDFLQSILMDRR